MEYLVYWLVFFSELNELDLVIVVINSVVINVFVVFGGVIGLNVGLFLNVVSEDEVVSVVVYEIVYVS